MLITIDVSNRQAAERELLDACVRDGVHAFNVRTGGGTSVSLIHFCNDELYRQLEWPPRPKRVPI
jgi:hypothetical protein